MQKTLPAEFKSREVPSVAVCVLSCVIVGVCRHFYLSKVRIKYKRIEHLRPESRQNTIDGFRISFIFLKKSQHGISKLTYARLAGYVAFNLDQDGSSAGGVWAARDVNWTARDINHIH